MEQKSKYSIRIGDSRELYDASWRRSCFRVDEKLRHLGFVLIRMEIPEEPMKTNWPRMMYVDIGKDAVMELTMDLDYAIHGDFNLFFQTALDVCMDEQLYLQECREHHPVQEIKTPTLKGETTMCICALL
jgi:hypothetical protein